MPTAHTSLSGREAMVVSPWFQYVLLYCICVTIVPSEARIPVYGDSRNDINGANYKPPSRETFQNFFKQIPREIPFAVPPHDPRFFMPRSFFIKNQDVGREGVATPNDDYYQQIPDYGYADKAYHDVVPPHFGRGPHLVYDPYELNGYETRPMASGYNRDYAYEPSYNQGFDETKYDYYMQDDPLTYMSQEKLSEQVQEKLPEHKINNGKQAAPSAAAASPPVETESNSKPEEFQNYLKNSKSDVQLPSYFTQRQPMANLQSSGMSDFTFIALVSGGAALAVCAVFGAGVCYLRLHKNKRDAAAADYPAYGVTGPNKDMSPGAVDRKMAQSAHMFHYQHQKQQMIALEKSSGDDRHCSASDVDSEEDGEEGDYTVYECPGLAPTGEMEVKNPLFSDEPTPSSPQPPTDEANGSRKKLDDSDEDD